MDMKSLMHKEYLEFSLIKGESLEWEMIAAPGLEEGSLGYSMTIRKEENRIDVMINELERVFEDEDGDPLVLSDTPYDQDDPTIGFNASDMISIDSIEELGDLLRDKESMPPHLGEHWPEELFLLFRKPWRIQDYVV